MQTPASTLTSADYPNFPELKKIDLSKVDAALIHQLQFLRKRSGVPLIPSPAHGAWSRTWGSHGSRHYAVDRLSDAGDLFPERDRLMEVWLYAVQMQEFGGIGLYFDTKGPDGKLWPMIHLDLRPGRLFWACHLDDGVRRYEYFPAGRFWEVITEGLKEVRDE